MSDDIWLDRFTFAIVGLIIVGLSFVFVGLLIYGAASLGDVLGLWTLPDQKQCDVSR